MIIFDLDGTLADCEHRRHFVDRNHPINEKRRLSEISLVSTPYPDPDPYIWKPNWKAFYEACDQDKPVPQTIDILNNLLHNRYHIQVWSGRCESVRNKTEKWLAEKTIFSSKYSFEVKMRPIGDNTPDDLLKEQWLNERCSDLMVARMEGRDPVKHDIEFIFDDRPKVIRMWRRRGIFVFNCCQHDEEF